MRSEVLRLSADGVAAAEISRLTGCPRSTCYRWIKLANRHHTPKIGRPSSLGSAIETRTLRELLVRNFSEPRDGDHLWSWKTVRAIIPTPSLSRQTVARFLQRCGVYLSPASPKSDRMEIPDGKKPGRSSQTIFYLLENCSWKKPDWMPEDEVPPSQISLWRFRALHGELFFGFGDGDLQAAHAGILAAFRTMMRAPPDAVVEYPAAKSDGSLSRWLVSVERRHGPRRRKLGRS